MAAKRPMVVSAIQITAIDGEKQATVDKMMDYLDVAGERGSELVVLPEVWTGLGYSAAKAYLEIAETIPGPTTELLSAKARQYGMYVVGVTRGSEVGTRK